METVIDWPTKTCEVQNRVTDSARWNDIQLREGDVVVATWAKSGTTWTQQIVCQLLRGAPEGVFTPRDCPWPDARRDDLEEMVSAIAAETDRRAFKTHLPIDALGIDPSARYIYVGRDARDVIWSRYNHWDGFTDQALAEMNARPGDWPAVGRPQCDIREYYLYWLDHDQTPGVTSPSFWDHVQGWWNARGLPNLLFVHFNQLKSDLRGEVGRIARFLDIEVRDALWPAILEHCSFDYMQRGGTRFQAAFREGGKTFFNKGTNGRWKDVLTPEEAARCDGIAAMRLDPDCARWLRTGALPD